MSTQNSRGPGGPRSRAFVVVAVVAATLAVAATRAACTRTPDGGEAAAPAAGLAADAVNPGGAAAAPATGGRREERRASLGAHTKDDEAVAYLREQFGVTIEDARSQIKALEKLVGWLQKAYPSDWRERLRALLARAFPGMEDELLARFDAMSGYNEWLKAHREELQGMSSRDRRAALADARQRFFGDDAAEVFAETLRHEQVLDAMEAMREDRTTGVGEKVDRYLDAIRGAYGEEAEAFVERRQTELMQNFVGLPAVQDELHALDAPARAAELENLRRSLGMDDEAIGRWRALDAERDTAWEAGERYMEKRRELEQAHQGADLEARLEALRRQAFGGEAETIRAEEESGFFRFGHRRTIGNE